MRALSLSSSRHNSRATCLRLPPLPHKCAACPHRGSTRTQSRHGRVSSAHHTPHNTAPIRGLSLLFHFLALMDPAAPTTGWSVLRSTSSVKVRKGGRGRWGEEAVGRESAAPIAARGAAPSPSLPRLASAFYALDLLATVCVMCTTILGGGWRAGSLARDAGRASPSVRPNHRAAIRLFAPLPRRLPPPPTPPYPRNSLPHAHSTLPPIHSATHSPGGRRRR